MTHRLSLLLACVALSTVACGAPLPDDDDVDVGESSAAATAAPAPVSSPSPSATWTVAWPGSTWTATGAYVSYSADRKTLSLGCLYGLSTASLKLTDALGQFGPGVYTTSGTGTKTASFSALERIFLGPMRLTTTHASSSANPGTSTVTVTSYAGPGSHMTGTFAFTPAAGSTLEPVNSAFDIVIPN